MHKRFALTISRGIHAENTNLWVKVEAEGITGWGEATAFSVGKQRQSPETLTSAFEQICPHLAAYHPLERQSIAAVMQRFNFPSAAWAAVDMALYDWLGKKVSLPLWQIWGLEPHTPPTSVTIGISTPEQACQRLRHWLEVTPVQSIKVKLGSPEGIDADQAMLKAILAEKPADAAVYVDANGGWSLADALTMSEMLAHWGIKYIEQPLAEGDEINLKTLSAQSPLPIFVDESCFTSKDIPALADRVHGINIKLMKSGGLTEALRMIHTAKASNLQVMLGCYSDSALANTAALQLAPLVDYLDLDSHLNLTDDPFLGATLKNGIPTLTNLPGLGVTRALN